MIRKSGLIDSARTKRDSEIYLVSITVSLYFSQRGNCAPYDVTHCTMTLNFSAT